MPKFKQRETCGERTHSTPLRVRLKEGEGRGRRGQVEDDGVRSILLTYGIQCKSPIEKGGVSS